MHVFCAADKTISKCQLGTLCSTGTYFSWEALAVAVGVGMSAGKVSLKHDVCEVKDEYLIF